MRTMALVWNQKPVRPVGTQRVASTKKKTDEQTYRRFYTRQTFLYETDVFSRDRREFPVGTQRVASTEKNRIKKRNKKHLKLREKFLVGSLGTNCNACASTDFPPCSETRGSALGNMLLPLWCVLKRNLYFHYTQRAWSSLPIRAISFLMSCSRSFDGFFVPLMYWAIRLWLMPRRRPTADAFSSG